MHRREYLIHLLTEAAEIAHNLLCSYLYAALSLKRGRESSAAESTALDGWRKTIMDVAIEEMGHLARAPCTRATGGIACRRAGTGTDARPDCD